METSDPIIPKGEKPTAIATVEALDMSKSVVERQTYVDHVLAYFDAGGTATRLIVSRREATLQDGVEVMGRSLGETTIERPAPDEKGEPEAWASLDKLAIELFNP